MRKLHLLLCLLAAASLALACSGSVKRNQDVDVDVTEDPTEVTGDGATDTPTTCTSDEECDDGDLCNGIETCGSDGTCETDPETVVTCPPTSTVCHQLECDPDTGDCVDDNPEAGTPCEEDTDLCTEDVCDGSGSCIHPEDDCDDDDVCTTDSCDPSTGCVHEPIEGCCNDDEDCDDGDPCTDDSCRSIGVCSHHAADCDDGDACTVDGCDSETGCTHETLDCDNGNVCTSEVCDSTTGCDYTFLDGTSCDDGDACTEPDLCDDAGHCVPGTRMPTWYRDADGDGYGDSSDSVCATTAPTGYVSDDTDCCDSEVDVNPGTTTYYCPSFTCAGSSTPSWDYNCGGADYQRWPDTGVCSTYGGGCWLYRAGWAGGTVPACGVTADYITDCSLSSGRCAPVTERRCQECI